MSGLAFSLPTPLRVFSKDALSATHNQAMLFTTAAVVYPFDAASLYISWKVMLRLLLLLYCRPHARFEPQVRQLHDLTGDNGLVACKLRRSLLCN